MATKMVEFRLEQELTKEELLKLKKDFRTQIVENGLDEAIQKSLLKLQTDLKTVINKELRTINNQAGTSTTQQTETNNLGQQVVNPLASDAEILKFITNGRVDLAQYDKASDFNTLNKSGVLFGQRQKHSYQLRRLTVRMSIDDGQTVEEQYTKAKNFFSSAVIALPNKKGGISYFQNTGIDISEFVKIKCSTLTGDGDEQPFKGMSPEDRFTKDMNRRSFADWTLKQEAIDTIRNQFVDLTNVVELIKDGKFREAFSSLKGRDFKIQEMKSQISKLVTSQNLPQGINSYLEILKTVDTAEIVKNSDEISTTYRLSFSYENTSLGEFDFKERVDRSIRSWVVGNQDSWYEAIIAKVDNLLKNFKYNKKAS